MRWRLSREIWTIYLFVVYAVVSKIFYGQLPARIPSHFDIHGVPDAYASKDLLIFGILGIMIAVYLLLTFIPFIDPLREKIERRYNVVLFLRDVFLYFFFILYGLCIDAAMTGRLNLRAFGVALGFLFILLGNYLPRLPQNWFIGIRSPWTMSSEIVWKKTHLLGGWLFIGMGLSLVGLSLLGVDLLLSLLLLVPVVLYIAIIYPYTLYSRIKKENLSGMR